MNDRKYLHIDIKKCLKSFLNKFDFPSDKHLIIDICTDGVPIHNNSAYSLWSVLINVVGYDHVQLAHIMDKQLKNFKAYM